MYIIDDIDMKYVLSYKINNNDRKYSHAPGGGETTTVKEMREELGLM